MAIQFFDVSQARKIYKYRQTHPCWQNQPFGGSTVGLSGSSLTSAAMCVKQTPFDLCQAGFNIGTFQWARVASAYGYNFYQSKRRSLVNVANQLLSNPVILEIFRQETIGPHFVVAYRFSGDVNIDCDGRPSSKVTPDMIYIFDPIYGETTLAKPSIIGINSIRIFSKQLKPITLSVIG